MRQFWFIDEVSNKLSIRRLKRDDFGINVTSAVHPKAVTTRPGVLISTSTSAKHRFKRAVKKVSIFLFKLTGAAKAKLLK